MKLIQRCPFCDSMWVNWNIKLEMTEELVYAHDCRECGRIHLTDHWILGGMPYLLPAITHKLQMRHKDRRAQHA
jgi:hypothetical protein